MNNDDVEQLCRRALELGRQGDFDEADAALVQAARGCGLLEIPLVGFGEAGRIMCASTARELLEERLKRGMTIQTLPEGFDLDDPYAEWRRKHGRPRVFFSYSHSDRAFVKSLARYLQANWIDVWIDEGEITFGDSLIGKLRHAIDSADVVLAILSKSSLASEWVRRELDVAMQNEIANQRMSIIPLLRDDSPLPGFLKGKLYADFSTSYRKKVNRLKLVESIRKLSRKS